MMLYRSFFHVPSYSYSPFSCCCFCHCRVFLLFISFSRGRASAARKVTLVYEKSLCAVKLSNLQIKLRRFQPEHGILSCTLHCSLYPSHSLTLALSVPQSTCCFSYFLKVFFVSLRPNEKFGATCCREKAQHAFRRAHKAATYTTRTLAHTHTRSTTENIMKKSLLKS